MATIFGKHIKKISLGLVWLTVFGQLGYCDGSEWSYPRTWSGRRIRLGWAMWSGLSADKKFSNNRQSGGGILERQNQEVTTMMIFATIGSWSIKWMPFFFLANEILVIYNITYPSIWPYFLVPRMWNLGQHSWVWTPRFTLIFAVFTSIFAKLHIQEDSKTWPWHIFPENPH